MSQPSLPPFSVCFPTFLPSISPATLPSSSVCDNISQLLKPPSTLHLAGSLSRPVSSRHFHRERRRRRRRHPKSSADARELVWLQRRWQTAPALWSENKAISSCLRGVPMRWIFFFFIHRQTDRQREGVRRRQSLSQAFPCLTSLTCFCKLVGNKTLLAGAGGKKWRHFVPVTTSAFIPGRRTVCLVPGCASENKLRQTVSRWLIGPQMLTTAAAWKMAEQADGFNLSFCFQIWGSGKPGDSNAPKVYWTNSGSLFILTFVRASNGATRCE